MKRSLFLAGSILTVLAFTAPAAQADSPREFLFNAQQGANSEILLGRLAAERGRSPAVREFGQTLVSDHQQARQEIRTLGYRFGIKPDRQATAEAMAERDRLADMGGRRFDREFIRYMVDDHRKDIAEFRDEAREGHGAVSDLARRQLPTLRKHLDMAVALDRNDGRFGGNFDQTSERPDSQDSRDWRERGRDQDRAPSAQPYQNGPNR